MLWLVVDISGIATFGQPMAVALPIAPGGLTAAGIDSNRLSMGPIAVGAEEFDASQASDATAQVVSMQSSGLRASLI